jgi:hypothetical protein
MGRLRHPPRLERQAVVIRGVELEASVWHFRHLPSAGSVVHADLRDALVAFGRADYTDHLS